MTRGGGGIGDLNGDPVPGSRPSKPARQQACLPPGEGLPRAPGCRRGGGCLVLGAVTGLLGALGYKCAIQVVSKFEYGTLQRCLVFGLLSNVLWPVHASWCQIFSEDETPQRTCPAGHQHPKDHAREAGAQKDAYWCHKRHTTRQLIIRLGDVIATGALCALRPLLSRHIGR